MFRVVFVVNGGTIRPKNAEQESVSWSHHRRPVRLR